MKRLGKVKEMNIITDNYVIFFSSLLKSLWLRTIEVKEMNES